MAKKQNPATGAANRLAAEKAQLARDREMVDWGDKSQSYKGRKPATTASQRVYKDDLGKAMMGIRKSK